MTEAAFAGAVRDYCRAMEASVTSWGRTRKHNKAVGSIIPESPHIYWVGVDVVYDTPPHPEVRRDIAFLHGLRVVVEATHDHLQPLEWKNPTPNTTVVMSSVEAAFGC